MISDINDLGAAGSSQTSEIQVLLIPLLLAALFFLPLTGCMTAPRPQRGGNARLTVQDATGTTEPGRSPSGAPASGLELQQPENPSGPSTQSRAYSNSLSVLLPAGTSIKQQGSTNGFEFTIPTPAQLNQTSGEHEEQMLGAAQKDNSREIAAKLAAVRPAFWLGLALIPIAGALLYFGWHTPALIAGGTGIGLMIFAQSLATHSGLMLILALAAAAIIAVFRAYEKGKLDHLIEAGKNLEKKL